jgi:hypothetical protein
MSRVLWIVLAVSACNPFVAPGGTGGGGGSGGGGSGGGVQPPGPTPVGTVTGPATTAHVTVQDGGTLATADGLVEVIVPPGALSADTDLTLTPITNNAPLGFGAALRLGPDGTTFSTPAKLVFHYASYTSATEPDLLLAASQDSTGAWQNAGTATLDTTAGTIAFDLPHFSDWSLSTCARLSVDNFVLAGDVIAQLSVLVQCSLPAQQHGPLGGATPTTTDVTWDKRDKMGMPGPGTLTPMGSDATLTGTDSPPPDPTVTVTAKWSGRTFKEDIATNSTASFTLEGMSYLFATTPFVQTTSSPTKSELALAQSGSSLTVSWPLNGEGGATSDPNNNLPVHSEEGSTVYQDTYNVPCMNTIKSLYTRVSVSHANSDRQWTVGSFQGTVAVVKGMKDCGGGVMEPDWTEVPLTGAFYSRWLKY